DLGVGDVPVVRRALPHPGGAGGAQAAEGAAMSAGADPDDKPPLVGNFAGYDPQAGLPTHVVGRAEKLPMPSLLRSLLSEHLDPGYAAAADERATGERPRRGRPAESVWQMLAALAIAIV